MPECSGNGYECTLSGVYDTSRERYDQIDGRFKGCSADSSVCAIRKTTVEFPAGKIDFYQGVGSGDVDEECYFNTESKNT